MKTFNLFLTVIMSLLLSTSVSAVHISTRKDPPSHHYIKEREKNLKIFDIEREMKEKMMLRIEKIKNSNFIRKNPIEIIILNSKEI